MALEIGKIAFESPGFDLEPPPPEHARLTDVAWLAGILEGEGCFQHTPSRLVGKKRWTARAAITVTLGSTDRDVVERVAFLIGGNVTERKVRPRHKPFWTTQVSGQKAEDTMRAIYPWMGTRRKDRIDALLALPDLSHRRTA